MDISGYQTANAFRPHQVQYPSWTHQKLDLRHHLAPPAEIPGAKYIDTLMHTWNILKPSTSCCTCTVPARGKRKLGQYLNGLNVIDAQHHTQPRRTAYVIGPMPYWLGWWTIAVLALCRPPPVCQSKKLSNAGRAGLHDQTLAHLRGTWQSQRPCRGAWQSQSPWRCWSLLEIVLWTNAVSTGACRMSTLRSLSNLKCQFWISSTISSAWVLQAPLEGCSILLRPEQTWPSLLQIFAPEDNEKQWCFVHFLIGRKQKLPLKSTPLPLCSPVKKAQVIDLEPRTHRVNTPNWIQHMIWWRSEDLSKPNRGQLCRNYSPVNPVKTS